LEGIHSYGLGEMQECIVVFFPQGRNKHGTVIPPFVIVTVRHDNMVACLRSIRERLYLN
jgi:hypothetical protein